MNPVDLHYKLALGLNQTYIEKNADYGDAFDKSLDNHGLTAAIVRMEDKMGRFSNLAGRPASMQVEESLEDTLLDLANYAIMTVMWLKTSDKPDTVTLYAEGDAYATIQVKQDYDGILAKRELAAQKLECGASSPKEFVDELIDIQGSFNNCLGDDVNAKADKVVENFNKKMDSIMNVTTDKVLESAKNLKPKKKPVLLYEYDPAFDSHLYKIMGRTFRIDYYNQGVIDVVTGYNLGKVSPEVLLEVLEEHNTK